MCEQPLTGKDERRGAAHEAEERGRGGTVELREKGREHGDHKQGAEGVWTTQRTRQRFWPVCPAKILFFRPLSSGGDSRFSRANPGGSRSATSCQGFRAGRRCCRGRLF